MPSPRRTKVKGRLGIYSRELAGRRRYEITFIDEDRHASMENHAGLRQHPRPRS